ncbi:unnamed protein product [Nippostrongylus brasiliensis]|uniref:C-type lectin domain-containing protein n=1 Tax=Nippostrongylus brasiliensis TaxID=27835 RepID=A0A158R346_NIPBR|nr:unnamed protein product [Nippostrongylus brasiliensis]
MLRSSRGKALESRESSLISDRDAGELRPLGSPSRLIARGNLSAADGGWCGGRLEFTKSRPTVRNLKRTVVRLRGGSRRTDIGAGGTHAGPGKLGSADGRTSGLGSRLVCGHARVAVDRKPPPSDGFKIVRMKLLVACLLISAAFACEQEGKTYQNGDQWINGPFKYSCWSNPTRGWRTNVVACIAPGNVEVPVQSVKVVGEDIWECVMNHAGQVYLRQKKTKNAACNGHPFGDE